MLFSGVHAFLCNASVSPPRRMSGTPPPTFPGLPHCLVPLPGRTLTVEGGTLCLFRGFNSSQTSDSGGGCQTPSRPTVVRCSLSCWPLQSHPPGVGPRRGSRQGPAGVSLGAEASVLIASRK